MLRDKEIDQENQIILHPADIAGLRRSDKPYAIYNRPVSEDKNTKKLTTGLLSLAGTLTSGTIFPFVRVAAVGWCR